MELQAVLTWMASGGGAGIVTYALLDGVRFLAGLSAQAKRWVAILLSFALASLAYSALVWLGYAVAPGAPQAWVEKLFLVGTSAFGLSQILHAHELRD